MLLTVFKEEPSAEQWARLIARSNRKTGRVVDGEVVAAETASLFPPTIAYAEAKEELGVSYSPISHSSAIRAGRILREHRRAGGPRKFMTPDFLIGAHAMEQADALAVIDRDYLRRYFKPLKLVVK